MDRNILDDYISAVIPVEKLRYRLRRLWNCVLGIREFPQILEAKKAETEIFLLFHDKNLQNRSSRGGAFVKNDGSLLLSQNGNLNDKILNSLHH